MRRREWSSLVAMLAVAMTAACGGGGGEQAGTQGTPEPGTAATPAPEPTPQVPANLPPGVSAEDVSAGQQLFATVCAACHGPDAKGTQLAPNLTDSEWLDGDGTFDSIVHTIQVGVPQPKQYPAPMPAMGGGNFNEQQVRQLAAYVWSLGGGK